MQNEKLDEEMIYRITFGLDHLSNSMFSHKNKQLTQIAEVLEVRKSMFA